MVQLPTPSRSSSIGAAMRRRLTVPVGDARRLQRGQVLPLFALMAVVLLGGAALLTDVAWWWVNEQRMQRAADAGALAGAIHLPGNQTLAFSKARLETAKNGYTDGVGGVIVTPKRDPSDPRKLIVDIDGPVNTNFAKVMSLNSVDVGVTGAASFVLPVPMGSPQSYYGVGFFQGVNPAVPSGDTGWLNPSSALNGTWNTPGDAFLDDDNFANVLPGDSPPGGPLQEYGGFSVDIPDGTSVSGIEISLKANDNANGGCKIDVDVQSAAGWSGKQRVTLPAAPAETTTPATLGGSSDRWGQTWSTSDIEGSNFLVRVEAVDAGNCIKSSDRVRLDQLQVKVYYDSTNPETLEVRSVPNPDGGTLATQGFWGAIFTSGGVRENGDRYAPLYIGGNNPPDGSNGGPNPDYDPNGYEYTIEVGTNGQVQLFDPVFCATGTSGSGGWLGTGDHWTTDGTGGGSTIGPVSVEFKLYNTQNTPYTISDDTLVGSPLTYDPGNATLGDFSGQYSRASNPPQNNGRADAQDCADHPGHNKWVLPPGWSGLSAGMYRLNVNTNLGLNDFHGAENLFSIWTKGTGLARVYGGGRMAAYTNLDDSGVGGPQQFYFSQIEDVHAGKTMVITLFDPGEANSDSFLRFLSPEGNSYDYATFDWYSNDGRSGTGVTEVQTAAPAKFNNRILTIEIGLPQDYGTGGLDPDGLGEEGWWKVEYDVRAANDTTTWEVAIRGNPVHLVLE